MSAAGVHMRPLNTVMVCDNPLCVVAQLQILCQQTLIE